MRVEDRADLEAGLDGLLAAQGPAMLEVVTDREEAVFPIVRPGTSYAEMDLGPFIRERRN